MFELSALLRGTTGWSGQPVDLEAKLTKGNMKVEIKPSAGKETLEFPILAKGKFNGLHYQFSNETTAYCFELCKVVEGLDSVMGPTWRILSNGEAIVLTQE